MDKPMNKDHIADAGKMIPPVSTDGLVETVAAEIDRYGEGLVPELRIVCTWLANHFRNDEDARGALTATLADRDATIERMRGALVGLRGMLASFEGQPTHLGDLFKVVDATLLKEKSNV
jgi:hypothetical protein